MLVEVKEMTRCRTCGKTVQELECIGGCCPRCDKLAGDALAETANRCDGAWWK